MMDLNFDDIQSESILDRVGGGYLGIFTGDYKIEFSEDGLRLFVLSYKDPPEERKINFFGFSNFIFSIKFK